MTPDYCKCQSCGHAILKCRGKTKNIINEKLDFQKITKPSLLDKYKRGFLLSRAKERKKLLDVGAGSGGFLFQVKRDFEKTEGLEITPECIEFSRKELGVCLVAGVSDLNSDYSAITVWHSLEHFSCGFLQKEMPAILKKLASGGKVIISVPNEDSFAFKLLGEKYPYYDSANHLQQFSLESLNQYMKREGFEAETLSFSLPYSGFCWLQGLLNIFNRLHNYLYYRKKRGWTFGLSGKKLKILDMWNHILAGVLAPLAIVGIFMDAIMKENGATLNVCYSRKRKH